jgi:hypothetical protein
MTNHVRRVAIAMVCAAGLASYAAAQQYPTQKPAAPSGAMNQPSGQTTLVGCLYRESDIPALAMSQPGGILDDYVLADASVTSAAATGGAVGTSGSVPPAGKLYEIQRISDQQLNPLVGKRVEVTGHIDADPEHLSGAAPDMRDLPEFETTSIREVSGTCPATPRF